MADVEAAGAEVEHGAQAREVAQGVVMEGRVRRLAWDEAHEGVGHEVTGNEVPVIGEDGDGAGGVARGGHDPSRQPEVRQVGFAADQDPGLERVRRDVKLPVPVHQATHGPRREVRHQRSAGAEGFEVGSVPGDGCAREAVQFRRGAEVVDVAMGDDDQGEVGGVHSMSGDPVVDEASAARRTGVDEDGASAQQQVGVDRVLAEHRNRNDLRAGHDGLSCTGRARACLGLRRPRTGPAGSEGER